MFMRTFRARWVVLPGFALLSALFASCGPGPKQSQFFDRIRLEPMLTLCEKHFESIEAKGNGGEVKGSQKLTKELWVAGSLSPEEIDPLLGDCKSYLLKMARENGATMEEPKELPEKQGSKGFEFFYTVRKERRGTIQVTATSTTRGKLMIKCYIEEDQYR
jgi:hypothetical protein